MDENLMSQTDDILEIDIPAEEIEQEIAVTDVETEITSIETTQDVIVEQEPEVVVDLSESMGWVSGDGRYHDSLLGTDFPKQHPIKAIDGLKEELDNLKAIKTVYSDQLNVANFYEWKDAAYDEYGYFVSLVPGTSTIKICDGADIFGVSVDVAGFIGGQSVSPPRNESYGLIVTSGLVDVRCELDVEVGDYVVSNSYGYAKKSGSNYGYKVIAQENKDGIEYAAIMLGVQADMTNAIGLEMAIVDERLDAAETNIVSAVNVANQAYNKANEINVSNQSMSDKVDNALGVVDKIASDVSDLGTQVSSSALMSAQAKAIAESAVTSAASMKNEAVEKANEALAENAELRREFEAKVAEIDTELDNTVSELEATKERFDTTIDDLRLDTEGQLADFRKEVADNYATTTQLAAVKTENSDAVAALKQEVSDTYATIESVASLKTETSDALAGFKQEVSEVYATQEMLTSLETEASKALTDYKQEVTKTYATQEMVSTLETNTSKALADYKQEVANDYATQEMVTKLETDTSKALSDYKQEVGKTYATNTSLATLKTETTNAIAASEEKATKTYASKSDLTTFESNTNIAMARIEQKADANGAYIQSTVSNMDKYSVGPHSQAYGFTRKQAQSVLEEGMIYVPTDDGITEEYVGEGDFPTYKRTFSKHYLYRWGEVSDGYGWITVDKNYSEDKLNTSAPSVFFSYTAKPTVAQCDTYGYWYTDGATLAGTAAEYEPYTLYKWDLYDTKDDEGNSTTERCWVPVATLAGNSQSRAVSQIRQDANSIELSVTTLDEKYAGTKIWVDNNKSAIQDTVTWTNNNGTSITTFMQEAGDNFASASQVAKIVDKDGNVNAASIVTAVNDAVSTVMIDADHIKFDGFVSFANTSDVEEIKKNATYDTKVEYALSSSSTEFIAVDGDDGKWSTTAPTWRSSAYMWQRTTITKGDGSTDGSSEPTCIQGANGQDGTIDPSAKQVNTHTRTQTLTWWQEHADSACTDKNWTINAGQGYSNTHLAVGDLAYIVGVATNNDDNIAVIICGTVVEVVEPSGSTSGKVTMNPSHLIVGGQNGYTPVKGVDYFDGTNGSDGTSIVWKGAFASAPTSPANGWAYYNSTAKASYVYQSGAWYQMSIDGVNGQDGNDGSSIVWKGEQSSAPTSPQTNWVYKDSDDGKVYIYNGSGWELMVLDGSDGQDGTNGTDGLSVFITYNDSTTTPNAPTGNGTSGGWHTNATSESVWMSQKVAKDANSGTWGTPIKIKGEDGKDAPTVVSEKKQFYLSTSNTSCVGGSWADSPSGFQYSSNKYMWSRSVYTMSDDSIIEGNPALDKTYTTISNWCMENDETIINGAHIATGTLDASQITTGTLGSHEYEYADGNIYTTAGTIFNLDTGELRSRQFAIDSGGNAYFNGSITIGALPDEVALSKDVSDAKTEAINSAVSTVEGKGYQTSNQVTTITRNEISTAKIKANQVDVKDLNAFGATIGGWKIEEGGLYADNNTIGLSSDKTTNVRFYAGLERYLPNGGYAQINANDFIQTNLDDGWFRYESKISLNEDEEFAGYVATYPLSFFGEVAQNNIDISITELRCRSLDNEGNDAYSPAIRSITVWCDGTNVEVESFESSMWIATPSYLVFDIHYTVDRSDANFAVLDDGHVFGDFMSVGNTLTAQSIVANELSIDGVVLQRKGGEIIGESYTETFKFKIEIANRNFLLYEVDKRPAPKAYQFDVQYKRNGNAMTTKVEIPSGSNFISIFVTSKNGDKITDVKFTDTNSDIITVKEKVGATYSEKYIDLNDTLAVTSLKIGNYELKAETLAALLELL